MEVGTSLTSSNNYVPQIRPSFGLYVLKKVHGRRVRDTGTRGDHTAPRGVARTLGDSGGWPAAILGNLSAPSKEKVWGPRDIPDQAEGRKGARRTSSSRNAICACGRTNENPLKKRNPPVPAGGSYTTPHDLKKNSNATEIPNRVSQACSRSKISSGGEGMRGRKEVI